VSDTVNGFIAAIGALGAIGEEVNLGSGFEVSIEETVTQIADIMGVAPQIHTTDERVRPTLSEVERLWADNSKAKELMDWHPLYVGLDGFRSGLIDTVAWFREPANLERFKSGGYVV